MSPSAGVCLWSSWKWYAFCFLMRYSVWLYTAGTTLEMIAGSDTSVFSGLFFRDFTDGLMRDPQSFPRSLITGNGATMMSNRISHFFDLHGQSLTLDTACSTGLVALHLACESIYSGQSQISIVSGSNLMLNPDHFVLLSSLGYIPTQFAWSLLISSQIP